MRSFKKLDALAAANPDWIATGNPGCMLQLRMGAESRALDARVVHPVELLDLAYGEPELGRMHGHLCLNLEPGGNRRKTLHIPSAERPVAGKNIAKTGSKQHAMETAKGPVSECVTRPGVPRAGSDPYHHVQVALDETLNQQGRLGRVIGAITVGQHENVSVNVGEHAPYDTAFARCQLSVDKRPGLKSPHSGRIR